MTFMNEIEPEVKHKLPIDDQTRANTAITNFKKMKFIENIFRIATKAAPNTMGNTQYPSTQTHWKKLIFPPNNLVFRVTTIEPPHMTKNTTPNSFPLEFIDRFRILPLKRLTKKERDRGGEGPKGPLNKNVSTVAEFLHSFWIALRVEFGNHHIFELHQDVFEVSKLNGGSVTMVSQMLYSRVSEWALT